MLTSASSVEKIEDLSFRHRHPLGAPHGANSQDRRVLPQAILTGSIRAPQSPLHCNTKEPVTQESSVESMLKGPRSDSLLVPVDTNPASMVFAGKDVTMMGFADHDPGPFDLCPNPTGKAWRHVTKCGGGNLGSAACECGCQSYDRPHQREVCDGSAMSAMGWKRATINVAT